MKTKEKRIQILNVILAVAIMLPRGLLAAKSGIGAGMNLLMFYAVMFVSIVSAVVFQTATHEAGHLVFGLMTGFRFLSYRILSLLVTHEEGKLKFSRFSIPGTLGQCLMGTPKDKEKKPYFLYNAGGVIFNLVSAFICYGFAFLSGNAYVRIFFFISGAYSLFMFFSNSIPSKANGVANDGSNILEMNEYPEAIDAFYRMLDATEVMMKGGRYTDLPDERIDLKEERLRSGSLVTSDLVFKENQLMDAHRFEEAEELLKKISDGDYPLLGYHLNTLKLDQKYLDCLNGSFEDIDDPQLLRFIKAAEKTSISVLRYQYVRCLYLKQEEQAEKYLQAFEKMKGSYPFKGEWQSEKELMRIARERISERG